MNHPILLVSQPSYQYRHPASRESSPSMDVVIVDDMRLESELISCALWDNALFPRP